MNAVTAGARAKTRRGESGRGNIHWNFRFAILPIPAFTPSRRAFTLVELIIVLTVATVIVGLGVMMIELLLRSERDATRALWNARVMMRLSQVFRDDVHTAEKVQVNAVDADNKKPELELEFSDGRRVEYEIDSHELTRTELAGGKTSHHDVFRLPPRSALRFEVVENPSIVRLEIRRARVSEEVNAREGADQTESVPARIIVVEGALKQDRRLAGEKR